MKTLQLKDIACYLPYGLKFFYKRIDDEPALLHTLDGITIEEDMNDNYDLRFLVGDDAYCWMSDSPKILVEYTTSWFKPILRPISDLYKPLEDGTIPIVELAKISFPNAANWDYCKGDNYSFSDLDNVRFIYNAEENAFLILGYDSSIMFAKNQIQLFDYLSEHHFDYRGLIEKGLAIDINTI